MEDFPDIRKEAKIARAEKTKIFKDFKKRKTILSQKIVDNDVKNQSNQPLSECFSQKSHVSIVSELATDKRIPIGLEESKNPKDIIVEIKIGYEFVDEFIGLRFKVVEILDNKLVNYECMEKEQEICGAQYRLRELECIEVLKTIHRESARVSADFNHHTHGFTCIKYFCSQAKEYQK